MFCDVSQHFRSFDVKSMQFIVIWLLLLFCDVTQKFWSFRRQIDAMHYNLITFLVLRCFDCFDVKSMQSIGIWLLLLFCDVTQKFWSFRRQIDAMHYNLITFLVLRCFDRFDVKSMQIFLLFDCVCSFGFSDRFDLKSMQFIVIDQFCSFPLFWMFCDVPQRFRSIWRQIDAMHYNLIIL